MTAREITSKLMAAGVPYTEAAGSIEVKLPVSRLLFSDNGGDWGWHETGGGDKSWGSLSPNAKPTLAQLVDYAARLLRVSA